MAAFLIAYDIADPRRLRKVARALERRAVRCQYSVFLFRGDEPALAALMAEVARMIRPGEDVVQAWPVPPALPPERFALGAVCPVYLAAVVVAGRSTRTVDLGAKPLPTPPTESNL